MRAIAPTILPWRDLIDGVDVEDALGSRLIARVHGVDPQIAGLALRIGPPPLCNRHERGLGFDVMQTTFAIAPLLAQVVQVRHRDRGQPLVLAFAVEPILALQNAPRGGSAPVLVRHIDSGQPLDAGPSIALRKTMTRVSNGRDRTAFPVASDQARHLSPT
jgi:hypothetical protein